MTGRSWMVVLCAIVVALVLTSCAQDVTQERRVSGEMTCAQQKSFFTSDVVYQKEGSKTVAYNATGKSYTLSAREQQLGFIPDRCSKASASATNSFNGNGNGYDQGYPNGIPPGMPNVDYNLPVPPPRWMQAPPPPVVYNPNCGRGCGGPGYGPPPGYGPGPALLPGGPGYGPGMIGGPGPGPGPGYDPNMIPPSAGMPMDPSMMGGPNGNIPPQMQQMPPQGLPPQGIPPQQMGPNGQVGPNGQMPPQPQYPGQQQTTVYPNGGYGPNGGGYYPQPRGQQPQQQGYAPQPQVQQQPPVQQQPKAYVPPQQVPSQVRPRQ